MRVGVARSLMGKLTEVVQAHVAPLSGIVGLHFEQPGHAVPACSVIVTLGRLQRFESLPNGQISFYGAHSLVVMLLNIVP